MVASDPSYIPAPTPPDEETRLGVVSKLLSRDFDLSKLDDLVAQVAELFDVPIAAATVLDNDWQHIPAKVGIDADKTERAVAFCGYTIMQQKPFCVLDAQQDRRFAGNPLVIGDPNIRFYAGARIMVGGMPVGALCAIGREPRGDIDARRIEQLESLAASASEELNRQFGER